MAVTGCKKITVLFVDAAVEFGGSLRVIGVLVDALDKSRFRPVVVGEVDVNLLRDFIKGDTLIYKVPRLYNYVHWSKTLDVINQLPDGLLRKVANYLLSALRSLMNSVYLVRLARIYLKEGVDIVHVNNGLNNLTPALVSVLLGRKFVVHIHGMQNPGFIQKILINKVPKFITISGFMKLGLIENGFPEERLVVIHNPICSADVSPETIIDLRKYYSIAEDEQVLGIVGRITRWKGHIEFLKAANRVMQAVPGLKVIIVGDFSGDSLYRDEIMQLVEASGHKDRIIFTGYVKDVERYYSVMDVCVHASIEPEPFGLVITEAMASGVAVIASDRGAPQEIITAGEDGFLVNPEDTEKLASTIIRLLGDDGLRSRIAARAKERVLRDYQADDYARAMERVYLAVLEDTVQL